MSLLIKLRHRIRAIETTKKVTHAMRLISMSSHTQLKGRHDALMLYKGSVHDLFKKVMAAGIASSYKESDASGKGNDRPLVILIGSQKGLCGIFNSSLFAFFEKSMAQSPEKKPFFIAIGKKAVDYIQTHAHGGSTVALYDTLTINNHLVLARKLTDMILQQKEPYTSVIVFSNVLRGFFMQKPMETVLLPLQEEFAATSTAKKGSEEKLQEEYIWEQAPNDVISALSQHYFEVSLQYLLFQSLLAEHAARFLSMDTATRNADNLLETTKISYNKLRQAKITKELAELAGSFQSE